jgi:hypothetical protein
VIAEDSDGTGNTFTVCFPELASDAMVQRNASLA